jgi:hypothetical protein
MGFIDHLYTPLGTTLYSSLTQSITVSTSISLATDLTHWRFFSFRGLADARRLTLLTRTHSAIFSASLAELKSRLASHSESRTRLFSTELFQFARIE